MYPRKFTKHIKIIISNILHSNLIYLTVFPITFQEFVILAQSHLKFLLIKWQMGSLSQNVNSNKHYDIITFAARNFFNV